MKVAYYPGCTLKTKARNLEEGAVASMAALGVEFQELPRWNCCGAVHSLAEDDLIHHVAPVRDLIRALEQGSDKVVTLCSMCYNTLARANLLMKQDEVKRKTINDFMTEEKDYHGEVEVLHFLDFIEREVGFDRIRAGVKRPLKGLKTATYYGCTLVRPRNVAIDSPGSTRLMDEFLRALGAEPLSFPDAFTCCGSYQILANPEAAVEVSAGILDSASRAGAEALVLSCPLCEYNLAKKQSEMLQKQKIGRELPVFYFTQLLAAALGLGEKVCRLELSSPCAGELLKTKSVISEADAGAA